MIAFQFFRCLGLTVYCLQSETFTKLIHYDQNLVTSLPELLRTKPTLKTHVSNFPLNSTPFLPQPNPHISNNLSSIYSLLDLGNQNNLEEQRTSISTQAFPFLFPKTQFFDCNYKPKQRQLNPQTCWKLLTVLPILFPTSGNFLGPKTKAATPAITTSSGTPRPNNALHVRPFLAGSVLVLVLVTTRALLLGLVLLKKGVVAMLVRKVELEEDRGREGEAILKVEEKDKAKDEISMVFVSWVLELSVGQDG